MRLGDHMPNLTVTSQNGQFSLSEASFSSWSVVMFHPCAFTSVCSTEMRSIAQLQAEERMPLIRFFSVMPNGADRIAAWVKELTADSLFPVLHDCISDPTGELTRAFGLPVAKEDEIGPRGYFIFDPAGVLTSYQILPTVVGFSSTELLRLVSALQLVRHGEMYAPADWQPGRELLSA